jgi:hypothetical protein
VPRFDFAISFAGTERPLARALAESLSRVGLRVFFDEHFEHEMLGQDGAEYLNRVFFEHSRYCVALVSHSYEGRSWTQLERRAAQAREHTSGQSVLLPVLVDATRPAWLLPTRIYFNLAERTLPELVEVLRRKHASEDTATFHEVGQVKFSRDERPLAVTAGWDNDDFLVWCTQAERGHRQVTRLVRDGGAGTWTPKDIPITHPSRWLLCGEANTLVGVPDMQADRIVVFRQEGEVLSTLTPPRRYRWKGATDCKERNGFILIAYCGGDVWHLSPGSLTMKELRPGTDDVQYTFVDFWNDNFVVALEERHELEVRRLADGALVATLESPVAAEGLSCFPEADLIAITGVDSLATIRLSSGAIVATEEIVGQGTFSDSRGIDAPLLGFISGFPMHGNALEIFDVGGSRRLLRRRSDGAHGWSSVAVSSSGKTVAAATANVVLLYERNA